MRYRLYSSFGASPLQIAGVVAFCQLSMVLGIWGLTGGAILLEPLNVLSRAGWSAGVQRAVAFLSLSVPALIFIFSLKGRPFEMKGHKLSLPPWNVLCAQITIASADLVLASAVLCFLLPREGLAFTAFCGIYVLSVLAGSLSQVPGGLGVLDASRR